MSIRAKVRTRVRELVIGRERKANLVECKHCGASLDELTTECPECGSTSIAEYHIPGS